MTCSRAVAAVQVNNAAPLLKISFVDNKAKTTRNNTFTICTSSR